MEGKHGRNLLTGMSVLAALAAAATGCQSTRLPALTSPSDLRPPSALTAAVSPIKLGTPMVRVPAPGDPAQTVWRPVQRDNRVPQNAVASSSWHPIQRGPVVPANAVASANVPPRAAPTTPRRDIIPVHMQTTQPGGQPRTRDTDTPPGQSPTLPPPRTLEVTSEMPGGVPVHHGPIGHPGGGVPRELQKTLLPPYIIEPPDVLLIDTAEGLPREQRVSGQHLVRPDGSVGLGIYGSVRVAGLTLDQARTVIADQIVRGQKLVRPVDPTKIFVDVLAYNSKVYYIITDGGGYGEQVYRLPITGNETVLDALSLINGLPPVASKKCIWVARRVPGHGGTDNILPVDWVHITQGGSAATNYQVLPGDRIYVHSDKLIRLDNQLAKIIAPIERLFGVTLLGSETVNSIRNKGTGTGTP